VRRTGLSVISASVVLVGLACGGAGSGAGAENQFHTAAEAGVATAARTLGSGWKPPEAPRFADAVIADRCGSPITGLGAPVSRLLTSATSPVLHRDAGEGTEEHGDVRTAVLVYRSAANAQASFTRIDAGALERCLIVTTNQYLDADEAANDLEPLPDATAESFDTTSGPSAGGDETAMLRSTFQEELLGGYDNTHDVALYVARRGPVVVTAIAASNSQNSDPGAPAQLARRVGTTTLARAAG
jgi:hypothetical protein